MNSTNISSRVAIMIQNSAMVVFSRTNAAKNVIFPEDIVHFYNNNFHRLSILFINSHCVKLYSKQNDEKIAMQKNPK